VEVPDVVSLEDYLCDCVVGGVRLEEIERGKAII
jgi:hypothetical protein